MLRATPNGHPPDGDDRLGLAPGRHVHPHLGQALDVMALRSNADLYESILLRQNSWVNRQYSSGVLASVVLNADSMAAIPLLYCSFSARCVSIVSARVWLHCSRYALDLRPRPAAARFPRPARAP